MTLEKINEILQTDLSSKGEVFEYLSCCMEIDEKRVGEYRWWDIYRYVVKSDYGDFISYEVAKSTGDLTPHELGWESSLDTIYLVEPIEVISYIYKRIEE